MPSKENEGFMTTTASGFGSANKMSNEMFTSHVRRWVTVGRDCEGTGGGRGDSY